MDSRPTWNEYFRKLTELTATRSTCERLHVGCILVKNNRIISQGYNGFLSGCSHVSHIIDGHEVATIHAEQNALIQASRVGVSLQGATLYCSMTPCYTCAKLIINAGIVRVVAKQDYQASTQTKRIFKETKVKLEILDRNITKY